MLDVVPRRPASKRQRLCGGVFCALAMAASVLFALQVRKDILAAFVDFGAETPNSLSRFLDALPCWRFWSKPLSSRVSFFAANKRCFPACYSFS
jgi:hypothetical protein